MPGFHTSTALEVHVVPQKVSVVDNCWKPPSDKTECQAQAECLQGSFPSGLVSPRVPRSV